GVLRVGCVREHPAADVETAWPDGREERLERVAVTFLSPPGEIVDVIRREVRCGHARPCSPCRPRGRVRACTIMPSVSMPARLGRYAVRRRIGSGGFATVWLAYDEQLDSPVAVKVLAENWTEDSHVRQR